MQVFLRPQQRPLPSEVDSLMEQTAAEIGTKIDAELMGAGDMSALKDPKVKQRQKEREAEQQLEDRLRQPMLIRHGRRWDFFKNREVQYSKYTAPNTKSKNLRNSISKPR